MKYLKGLSLLLSALILFHGCTLYKSANVTLEEALQAETKVRIKTKDKKTLKFRKVLYANNQYYGTTQYKDKFVRVGIDEDNIDKIQVKDKGKSTLLNIGIPVVIIGILAIELAINGISY